MLVISSTWDCVQMYFFSLEWNSKHLLYLLRFRSDQHFWGESWEMNRCSSSVRRVKPEQLGLSRVREDDDLIAWHDDTLLAKRLIIIDTIIIPTSYTHLQSLFYPDAGESKCVCWRDKECVCECVWERERVIFFSYDDLICETFWRFRVPQK